MASVLYFISLLPWLFSVSQSLDCPTMTPPEQGVLKCQRSNGQLQCLSTCYGPRVFDTGEAVVVKICNHTSGKWENGPNLPACEDRCHSRILHNYLTTEGSKTQPFLTASTDANKGLGAQTLADRAVIGILSYNVWQPEIEDLSQFVMVEFPEMIHFNGVLIRGDGVSSFVTSFRLLFSEDGITWFPYTDGEMDDIFFKGPSDSVTEEKHIFLCPHQARFVKINPLTWKGKLSMAFDLLGCPVHIKDRTCRPLSPPEFGVVDCEVDGANMYCTAYCVDERIFKGEERVITRTCQEHEGQFDKSSFPECVSKGTTVIPSINITGLCTEREKDCFGKSNGDYQFCGDCHYFGTCSHGYLYVRACPAHLQFDALNGLCDYKSRTCTSKQRYP